ncbi:Ovochymase-2, partial [Basidiobolus ranarum]
MNYYPILFLYILYMSLTQLILTSCARPLKGTSMNEPQLSSIIGGIPAFPKEFPSMALILMNGLTRCGSAIVADRWLVTAAHCFIQSQSTGKNQRVSLKKVPSNQFTVSVGSVENVQTQPLSIQRYIIHPGFDIASSKNDMAVVELKEPQKFDDNVRP